MKKYLATFVIALYAAVNAFASSQPSQDLFCLKCTEHVNTIALGFECENSDTVNLSEVRSPIFGLSVDMSVERSSEVYLVRIIMEDEDGRKYLVAEDYPMLGNNGRASYDGYCEETAILWNVVPKSLRVHSYGARVSITGLKMATSIDRSFKSSKEVSETRDDLLKQQARLKCDAINECISRMGKLWHAGVTSLSSMPFEERMRIMGFSETSLTNGIEFYSGGIFDIVGMGTDGIRPHSPVQGISNASYIPEFSWRDRHGKDWLTPVKDQGESGYCSAFSAISCVEALANLFFNQKIDMDLSEQEAAVCNGNTTPWSGMTRSEPLYYIKNHGVCEEAAYPFVNDSAESHNCRSGEIFPDENVMIAGIKYITLSEDSIKKAIMRYGPLSSGYRVYDYSTHFMAAHAMCLYGFDVISVGDTVSYLENYAPYSHGMHLPIVVGEGNGLIGRTVWKFKNSYIDGDASNPQYMNITYDDITRMDAAIALLPPVTSANYSEADIICEDSDGDGYYFWGIGPKPATCPPWVPDEADGDDSNPTFGPMDEYGYMSEVSPNDSTVLYLEGTVSPSASDTVFHNAVIRSGDSFRLQGSLRFLHGATLTVESGGYFLIDGGSLITAKLILMPGSTMVIDNHGEYMPPYNTFFEVPSGAFLSLLKGTIQNHYQPE